MPGFDMHLPALLLPRPSISCETEGLEKEMDAEANDDSVRGRRNCRAEGVRQSLLQLCMGLREEGNPMDGCSEIRKLVEDRSRWRWPTVVVVAPPRRTPPVPPSDSPSCRLRTQGSMESGGLRAAGNRPLPLSHLNARSSIGSPFHPGSPSFDAFVMMRAL